MRTHSLWIGWLAVTIGALPTPSAAAPSSEPGGGARVRVRTVAAPTDGLGGDHRLGGHKTAEGRNSVTLQGVEGSVVTYAKPGRWLVGTLLARDLETIRLRSGTSIVTVRRDAITRFEVSRGGGRGGGATIGAIAGFAVGASLAAGCNGGFCPPVWLPGAIVAAPGALIGLVVAGGERWKPARLDDVHLSAVPARGGAGLQLTVGF